MDLERKKRIFLYYVLISQKGRKSWGLQASGAYPPRGFQLFPLADTPANSCINHVCCEQKGTSGFIMPAFGSAKTQRSSQNHKGSYLFLNFTCLSGSMNVNDRLSFTAVHESYRHLCVRNSSFPFNTVDLSLAQSNLDPFLNSREMQNALGPRWTCEQPNELCSP